MSHESVFAARMLEARTARQMTQAELAKRIGRRSHRAISEIENGHRHVSLNEVYAIAAALDVDAVRLLGTEPLAVTTVVS